MEVVDAHQVLECGATPVWLVTVQSDDVRAGLVCTTAVSVSIVPSMPRVILTLAKEHHTAQVVQKHRAFALSLLEESQIEVALRFGMNSGHSSNKWADLPVIRTPDGHPIVEGVAGWIDCTVEASFDAGDRWIVLAQCATSHQVAGAEPMSVSSLISKTDDSRKADLKRQRMQDAERDRLAIQRWRSSRAT